MVYSRDFKLHVLEELRSGSSSISALCREYGVSRQTVYLWEREYFDGMLDSKLVKENGYEHKIAQLERKIGQLTMDNELLKKALRSVDNLREISEKSSEIISPLTRMSKGGAK